MSSDVSGSRRSSPTLWIVLVAGGLILFVVIGFMVLQAWQARLSEAHQELTIAQSMSNMRQILMAANSYQIEHGEFPDTIDRLSVESLEGEDSVMRNPREGYVGYRFMPLPLPYDDIAEPFKVPALYEVLEDGSIDPVGIIGFADGRVALSPDFAED